MESEAKPRRWQFGLWTLVAFVVVAASVFAYLRVGGPELLVFLLIAIVGRYISRKIGPNIPAIGFFGALVLTFVAVFCYYLSIGVYYSRDLLFFVREFTPVGVVSNCFLTAMFVSTVGELLAWFIVGPPNRKKTAS